MPALADIARTGGSVGRFNNSGQNEETTSLVSGSQRMFTVETPLACRSGLLLRPNFRNPFLGQTPASPVERRSRKSAAHSARYPGAGGGLSSPCWEACNSVDEGASMDAGAVPARSTNRPDVGLKSGSLPDKHRGGGVSALLVTLAQRKSKDHARHMVNHAAISMRAGIAEEAMRQLRLLRVALRNRLPVVRLHSPLQFIASQRAQSPVLRWHGCPKVQATHAKARDAMNCGAIPFHHTQTQ